MLGAVWVPHKFDIEKHTFAGSSKRHYRKNGDMALIISGNLYTLTGSIPKKVWDDSVRNPYFSLFNDCIIHFFLGAETFLTHCHIV